MIRRPRSLRQSHTERSSPTYILIATKLSDQSISKPYSAATPRATYAPQSERGSNAKPPPESSPAKKDPRTKKNPTSLRAHLRTRPSNNYGNALVHRNDQ